MKKQKRTLWTAARPVEHWQLGRLPAGAAAWITTIVALIGFCGIASAQVFPVEIRQEQTPYNLQSQRGVPISTTNNVPPGSDGRAPTADQQAAAGLTTTAPTANQFKSLVSFGGVAHPRTSLFLNTNAALGVNLVNIGLPTGRTNTASGTAVAMILKSALVGAPFVSQSVSFSFGSIIPVPDTDENGTLLATNVRKEDYWLAEPFSTNAHANAGYYWSPHARLVFAVQPGPISITWKKAQSTTVQPSDFSTNPSLYSVESGNYYRLFTARYIVSGSTQKAPRQIYWTESVFRTLGKPVAVPSARVSAVNIVYNNNFPERVTEEFQAVGQSSIVSSNRLQELRTLWFDQQQGQIYAYNREGRVFLELLGDTREDGVTRQHLGFEIVDVRQQPTPADIMIDLGDRLTAFQDGREDSDLVAEPLLNQSSGQPFYHRQNVEGTARVNLYAVRETANLNDLLVHWLEQGEVGLRWPRILARYKLVWPVNIAKYSHYIRPVVATEQDARLTAVELPKDNAPQIEYQDPLDRPRAKLTEQLQFYTYLTPQYPAHRTLLRFISGESIAFERVFSWLDSNLIVTNFAGTVATNLTAWNPTNQTLHLTDDLTVPRVIIQTVSVGRRIGAPVGEKGSGSEETYFAGYIHQAEGTAFNVNAYINPFSAGFDSANRGAIIPVNALPGNDRLEVWWFRPNPADLARGFKSIYWPSVVGRYTLQWPSEPLEIVLASNDGSGGLGSLPAKGKIYVQNNSAQPGYNPNEEHALMIGGQAYALRDDLNLTTGANPSSQPFVLLEYTEADLRPAMLTFKVLREKPGDGIIFDYIVEAGTILQAPMPLPLLPKPVEGSGSTALDYNQEPGEADGDLPVNWNESTHGSGPYSLYKKFTYRDRKFSHWVYRGLHAGQSPLQAGSYNTTTKTFTNTLTATAIVDNPFNFTIHTSRRAAALVVEAQPLPAWLVLEGLTLKGLPRSADVGATNIRLVVTDAGDGVKVTNTLALTVLATGTVLGQAPLSITSTNRYAGANVTYVGRPPFLASSPEPTNSFTMRFYYKTQDGFAWPGDPAPPSVGTIVPYLRPRNASGQAVGDAKSKNTASLDIVYRPAWPPNPPKMEMGETLMEPKRGLPAIRGETSLQILYQQSIAQNITNARPSFILHDATREKVYDITGQTLEKLPEGVRKDFFQGKTFFPNLPPHLAERLFFDPNRGTKGHLVFKGEFKDEALGEKYLLLNVLRGSELALVKALCPTGDTDKARWDAAIDGLATAVETFHENPQVPGTFIPNPALTVTTGLANLVEVGDDDTAVDSYALSASGPGFGYVTLIAGNGFAFTPPGEPVAVKVMRVLPPVYRGELKVIAAANPLNEQVTIQHTADLAGRFSDYEYDWRIAPPVDGAPPPISVSMTGWQNLANALDLPRYTLGGAGIQALVDNYLVMRYRPKDPSHPLFDQWSDWTQPALAEGWIKRVLAGINPFGQRVTDLFNNRVNTDVSILTQAGRRWEGDVALNLENINNYGLIEIYETVLRRGKSLSIGAGINFGPANDALLLAAGYLNDLYMMLGNEAWADAANPTIGIGTKDKTYGDIATALFSFKGQVPSLLEEELALMRGRDDFLQPGVEVTPVYNRLFWNYTRGIDSGEVIYALNYNIQENADTGVNGVIDADDARKMFPQGHGDAYGHYLTALKGYYSLLLDTDFDWVPRTEAVNILGKAVQVDYSDERKFAAAAAAVARTGKQVFDLTWRRDYQSGVGTGWEYFSTSRTNASRVIPSVRYWGMDHSASRAGQGAFLNWVVGNAILPDVDNDPTHEGIQKIDRTTVPELKELVAVALDLQNAMDNAEAKLNPLGLPESSIAFDINPSQVVGASPVTHFEQIFERARTTLNNAVASFDDAKDVTRLMRSEGDSLADLQTTVARQELAYTNLLIEIYGTPYPDDIGPGKIFKTGYAGPDLFHYNYVDVPEITVEGIEEPKVAGTFRLDVQNFPDDWTGTPTDFNFVTKASDPAYSNGVHYIEYKLSELGFFEKPDDWVGKRRTPGKIQQAISDLIKAQANLKQALSGSEGAKGDLDYALAIFNAKRNTRDEIRELERSKLIADQALRATLFANDVYQQSQDLVETTIEVTGDAAKELLPQVFIAGLAAGGDLTSPARAAIEAANGVITEALKTADFIRAVLTAAFQFATETANVFIDFDQIAPKEWDQELREAVVDLAGALGEVQGTLSIINQRLRELDDANRNYRKQLSEGDRIQQEREIFRQRAAAVIQGFRTRDAAFRVFRNEKLERYKTLFDLAVRYGFLAAKAYDYETGLLYTDQGRQFLSRIVNARALGVVRNGEPQFAGSNTGDPGLSSALAEMHADWLVLKGRLGFNNPDAYGTTVSLRTEHFRILPGADGDSVWRDELERGRKFDLLDDQDVRRYCMQIDRGDGLPVPGIILTFSTTVAGGFNFFGKPLAATDHAFSPSSFATKIYAAGVALEGYRGMDNPAANSSAVNFAGATSPSDPSTTFLDPLALSATPYVYLIPVGVDSMRSPPLGDVSVVRSWSVDDITIPLPFNIGASDFSTKKMWQSSDSLTEPLFGIRKHQAFRPVSTSALFSNNLYGSGGQLVPTQYTNRRLIGRSVWNSQWKLVIPGDALLNNPDEGLDRLVETVKDIKFHFVTYSYAGN